jgi:hypothetical protein
MLLKHARLPISPRSVFCVFPNVLTVFALAPEEADMTPPGQDNASYTHSDGKSGIAFENVHLMFFRPECRKTKNVPTHPPVNGFTSLDNAQCPP